MKKLPLLLLLATGLLSVGPSAWAGPCTSYCTPPGIPASCIDPAAAKAALDHLGTPGCNHPELCAAYDSAAASAIAGTCVCRSTCTPPALPGSCGNRTVAAAAIARIGSPACNHPELCGAYDKQVEEIISHSCDCRSSCTPPGIPQDCHDRAAAETAVAHLVMPACNHPELCANYDTLTQAAVNKACSSHSGATGR